MKRILSAIVCTVGLAGFSCLANAADLLDPTPVSQQIDESPNAATSVDALNFEFSILGGAYQRNVLDTASNAMFTASIATPIPYFERFGAQIDAAIGVYDDDFTSSAAGLHLFWRDPSTGMIGIYGDWAYVNPEHAGRLGGEFAVYNGRWSLDVLAGIQFGQHVFTEFIDEVDLSYYFTDNTRGSIGHRYISRGNVGNVSFEHLMTDQGFDGWSIFGEIEAGEDNYVGGWGGIRYALGSTANTLIERDRQSSVQVRIPRNIASVTQCGDLDVPRSSTFWRSEMTNLCSDEDEINKRSTPGITKN
ncbi:MAG: hypothetical protein ACR2O3_04575 [Rhizobiaceae bacterium]